MYVSPLGMIVVASGLAIACLSIMRLDQLSPVYRVAIVAVGLTIVAGGIALL